MPFHVYISTVSVTLETPTSPLICHTILFDEALKHQQQKQQN